MPIASPIHRARSYKPRGKWTRSKENRNKTTTERGYGSEWRKIRRFVIQRDKGLCQPCLTQGRYTEFQDVDHIKPKTQGGTDDLSNLQCICKPCHQSKTGTETTTGRAGSK